jgi:hypothetical protein
MAHFSDDSPCTYFGDSLGPSVRAVGWLDPAHTYNRDDLSLDFAYTLAKLLVDPWQPVAYGGFHKCSFCRLTQSTSGQFPTSSRSTDFVNLSLGATNLFVPAQGFVYAAPSLVIHYIDCHNYAPPVGFVDAVMNCPPMGSIEYLRRLKQASPSLVLLATGRC